MIAKIDIKTAIGEFAKINIADSHYSQLIDNAVNRAIYDVTRDPTKSVPELIKYRFVITSSNMITGLPTLLPQDFMKVHEVRYHTPNPTTTGREWVLPEYSDRVPPAPIYGKPNCYRILGKNNGVGTIDTTVATMMVEPYTGIENIAGEGVTLDYYQVPDVASGYTVSNVYGQEIQDRAIAYILAYEGKNDKLQALMSFIRTPQPQQESAK